MKLLFDFFPLILFFAAYQLADIYVATAVGILATLTQVGWMYFRHGKVDKMLWVTLGLIVVFGGMTLLLRDPTFIKWKPTILFWLFAGVLAGAMMLGKNLIRTMLSAQLTLPDVVWTRLTLSWIAFFACLGVLNLYFAYYHSEAVWVNFKLFGDLGLTFVFLVAQLLVLSRYIDDKDTEKETS